MYGGIELPSATLEGRIPYSARSFRKSLPPTPTANGRHNCTLPIPLSSYRGEQQQQHHSQAEIHYLCSNVPVYEEIPNYIRSDQVRQIHHNNKQMAPTESNRLKNLWATGKEGLIIRASMDSYEIPCSPYHLSTQSESPVSPETTFLAAAISAGRTLTLGDIQSSVTNSLNSPVSHYSSGSNSLQSPKKLSEMNNSQSDDSFVRAVDNISYLDCTNGGRESGYGTEGCNLGLWDSPRSNKKLFLSPQLSGTKKLSETPGCPPSSQRQSRPCRTPTANGHSLAQQFARDIPVELFVPNGRHPKSVVHFVDSEDLDSSAYV